MKKILLIDDEHSIAETIIAYAKRDNMHVDYVDNGEDGLKFFQKNNYNIIILDWMLPGISGPEIIKIIRKKSNIPILMISARDIESDIVIGLELGADDYITKPFGPRELIARIHSLLRRTEIPKNSPIVSKNKKLTFSLEKREICKNGQPLKITPNEFRILNELYQNIGKVISREILMEKALGYRDFLNDRTLDTHIKNIRQKIEDNPKKPQFIITIREIGFKLVL